MPKQRERPEARAALRRSLPSTRTYNGSGVERRGTIADPAKPDRRRPTRPLERLVRLAGHNAAEANTKPTERRRNPKSEPGAKDRVAEVNAAGLRSPVRVRTPGTEQGARTAAEGKEPPAATKPPTLDANRKEMLRRRERCYAKSNGSGVERRATTAARRSRTPPLNASARTTG